MGNFIDYNTSITKGAAEQASNAELAAKYKSMMADQAVGKHVEAAAMQAHDVGAAKGYEAGTRDGGLATLASMFPQAPTYNPFQMMAKNAEMQGLVSSDGGTVIPVFVNYIDVRNDKVAHGEVANRCPLRWCVIFSIAHALKRSRAVRRRIGGSASGQR